MGTGYLDLIDFQLQMHRQIYCAHIFYIGVLQAIFRIRWRYIVHIYFTLKCYRPYLGLGGTHLSLVILFNSNKVLYSFLFFLFNKLL